MNKELKCFVKVPSKYINDISGLALHQVDDRFFFFLAQLVLVD